MLSARSDMLDHMAQCSYLPPLQIQIQEIRERISNLTRVPWKYAEHLQLLK